MPDTPNEQPEPQTMAEALEAFAEGMRTFARAYVETVGALAVALRQFADEVRKGGQGGADG